MPGQLDLSPAGGVRHPLSCRRCLRRNYYPKVKCGENLLNPLGTFLFGFTQVPRLFLIRIVLGNAVATQNFEYTMFNTVDKPLYIFCCNFRRVGRLTRAYCAPERRSWRGSAAEVRSRRKNGAPIPFVGPSKRPWHGAGADVFAANYLAENCVYGK